MSSWRGASTIFSSFLDVMYIIRFHYLALQYMLMHFAASMLSTTQHAEFMKFSIYQKNNAEAAEVYRYIYINVDMIQTTFFVQHCVTWKSKIRRMSCKKSLKRRQPLNSWQASWMNRHQRRHQWPICCGVVRLLFQIPLLRAFILWFVLIHHRQISNFSNVKALRNNHMFPWSFVTRIDMRSTKP